MTHVTVEGRAERLLLRVARMVGESPADVLQSMILSSLQDMADHPPEAISFLSSWEFADEAAAMRSLKLVSRIQRRAGLVGAPPVLVERGGRFSLHTPEEGQSPFNRQAED